MANINPENFQRLRYYNTLVSPGYISNAAAGTKIASGQASFDVTLREGQVWNHTGGAVTFALFLVPIGLDASSGQALPLNNTASYSVTANGALKFIAPGEVFMLPAGYDLFAVASAATALRSKFSGIAEV